MLFIVDLLFIKCYLCILASCVSEHLLALTRSFWDGGEKTWNWQNDRMRSTWGRPGRERPNRDRGTPKSHYRIMAPPPFRSGQSLIPSRTTFILLRICQICIRFLFHSLQVNSPIICKMVTSTSFKKNSGVMFVFGGTGAITKLKLIM